MSTAATSIMVTHPAIIFSYWFVIFMMTVQAAMSKTAAASSDHYYSSEAEKLVRSMVSEAVLHKYPGMITSTTDGFIRMPIQQKHIVDSDHDSSYSTISTGLKVGFYQDTCPYAELLIRSVAAITILQNPGVAAGLIRLHFHDCFVRGCDGSVLIDSTPGNLAEKDSPANNPSLRGFEVIDQAKSLLETFCPATVSCADIIAFAARDANLFSGGFDYTVPSGRRDGSVSNISDVFLNLPSPFSDVQQLNASFTGKGLSLEEMVILSGAHTIGRAHCGGFVGRLFSFNSTTPQDPSLDPKFASFLKTKCPQNFLANATVSNDNVTPNFNDNQYYKNAQKHQVLFTSDQTLQNSAATTDIVAKYAANNLDWKKHFTKAMVHLGTIDVLTGNKGQIRLNCHVVNK